MRASDLDLIFVPESGEVPPDHWIARWAAKLSTASQVEPGGAAQAPGALVAAARGAQRPVLLIGHSTGALAVALAAPDLADLVRGAFLVAPPGAAALRTIDHGAWPEAPRARLPFPATLVASRTDPWATLDESLALAQAWGADFVDAGDAGRIDPASGHGPWPDGLLKLGALLKRLG